MHTIKKITVPIAIILIFSIITSSYLLYLHYAPSGSSFCNFNTTLNCDIVNKSIYAEIFGIPVALLSLITFTFLLITLRHIRADYTSRKTKHRLVTLHMFILGFSALFAGYLLYVEIYYLLTFCVLCILLDIFILLLFLLTIKHRKHYAH